MNTAYRSSSSIQPSMTCFQVRIYFLKRPQLLTRF